MSCKGRPPDELQGTATQDPTRAVDLVKSDQDAALDGLGGGALLDPKLAIEPQIDWFGFLSL